MQKPFIFFKVIKPYPNFRKGKVKGGQKKISILPNIMTFFTDKDLKKNIRGMMKNQ